MWSGFFWQSDGDSNNLNAPVRWTGAVAGWTATNLYFSFLQERKMQMKPLSPGLSHNTHVAHSYEGYKECLAKFRFIEQLVSICSWIEARSNCKNHQTVRQTGI
jgi:hypothetical protein